MHPKRLYATILEVLPVLGLSHTIEAMEEIVELIQYMKWLV